ncbi:MAG: DUF1415 domain-containing protein [Pseudomonadota bacterium]
MNATIVNVEKVMRAEQATRQWLERVVIGLNLCPFARRELDGGRVRIAVTGETDLEGLLMTFATELARLNNEPAIETTLVVIADAVPDFLDYLDLLDMAQGWLEEQELEGVYQLASFHPDYQFADSDPDDEANYTNRSPFPVIHILREESVESAVASHPNAEGIPDRNIRIAREKGLPYWQTLLKTLTTPD